MKKGDVVLIDWECNSQGDLQEALEKNGLGVITVKWTGGDYEDNPVFAQTVEEVLDNNSCRFVISFNYFPVVSKICEERKIKYAAWVYDSPHLTLYSKTIFSEWNYLFLFDSVLYQEFQAYGVKHLYYLPLAVNVSRLDKLLGEETKEWEHEISFLGSLYERNYYDGINYLPEETRGYLDGIMQAQKKVYGYNFLNELLNEKYMKQIRKHIQCGLDERFFVKDTRVFADLFLGQKVTHIERTELLSMLTQYYPVSLYTASWWEEAVGRLEKFDYVDYATQMPKVFRKSKINLNISLRSIQAGVPLRVYDILGAGGFLITNYQADLTENGFVLGEDLVVYESKEDLLCKIDYYLNHEEERLQIAENGRRKVSLMHTYDNRVQCILEKIAK